MPDTASVDKQFVYLVAKSDNAHFSFHKEAKILLSYKDGMVLIQTDKPIYTPRQSGKKSQHDHFPFTEPHKKVVHNIYKFLKYSKHDLDDRRRPAWGSLIC